MSAVLCSPKHIGRLACFSNNPMWMARLLAVENTHSVEYRYPDLAGKAATEFLDSSTDAYISSCEDEAVRADKLYDISTLKLAQFYDYQSCEHPEWEERSAYKHILSITQEIISRLPGYEEADWVID